MMEPREKQILESVPDEFRLPIWTLAKMHTNDLEVYVRVLGPAIEAFERNIVHGFYEEQEK